jgi:hypothetical protein
MGIFCSLKYFSLNNYTSKCKLKTAGLFKGGIFRVMGAISNSGLHGSQINPATILMIILHLLKLFFMH